MNEVLTSLAWLIVATLPCGAFRIVHLYEITPPDGAELSPPSRMTLLPIATVSTGAILTIGASVTESLSAPPPQATSSETPRHAVMFSVFATNFLPTVTPRLVVEVDKFECTTLVRSFDTIFWPSLCGCDDEDAPFKRCSFAWILVRLARSFLVRSATCTVLPIRTGTTCLGRVLSTVL